MFRKDLGRVGLISNDALPKLYTISIIFEYVIYEDRNDQPM